MHACTPFEQCTPRVDDYGLIPLYIERELSISVFSLAYTGGNLSHNLSLQPTERLMFHLPTYLPTYQPTAGKAKHQPSTFTDLPARKLFALSQFLPLDGDFFGGWNAPSKIMRWVNENTLQRQGSRGYCVVLILYHLATFFFFLLFQPPTPKCVFLSLYRDIRYRVWLLQQLRNPLARLAPGGKRPSTLGEQARGRGNPRVPFALRTLF